MREELWCNNRIIKAWSDIDRSKNVDKDALALLRRMRDELQSQIDAQDARIIGLERVNKELVEKCKMNIDKSPWCQMCGAPAKHIQAGDNYIATYCNTCFETLEGYQGE